MKKIAIYDFDGTITYKDTLPLLLKQWSKMGYSFFRLMTVKPKLYFFYFFYQIKKNLKMDVTNFKVMATNMFLEIFKNMEQSQINAFFYACADSVDEEYYQPLLAQMKKDKKEGYVQYILSGTYDPFIARICEILNCDYGYATIIQYKEGRIDYRIPLNMNMGENKLKTLLANIDENEVDWKNSKSYADSFSDLEIMMKTGNPIAVKPDEKLKAYAKAQGWRII